MKGRSDLIGITLVTICALYGCKEGDEGQGDSKRGDGSAPLPKIDTEQPRRLADMSMDLRRNAESYIALWDQMRKIRTGYEEDMRKYLKRRESTGPESRPFDLFLSKPEYPYAILQSTVEAIHEARNGFLSSKTAYLRECAKFGHGNQPLQDSGVDRAIALARSHEQEIEAFFRDFPPPPRGR